MRARNIKPGYFKNEDLAECPFEARLLFAGLWCLADRSGRMEYRPKRIKAEIFPFDSVDVPSMVQALCKYGFARIYVVDGVTYLDLPTLTRNHHPTVKPTDLMRYLCRLITPPGGIVLDPFTGSGSTGRGAVIEGFSFIGIEREADYCEIARKRIAAAAAQGSLFHEVVA